MNTDDEDIILSIITLGEFGFNRYERDIVDLLLVDMICGPSADVDRIMLLEEKAEQRRRRKSPEFRCRMPIMILDDGSRVGRPPTKSVWYENFIATTPTHQSVLKDFRKAFRLPHSSFLDLCDIVREEPIFGQWRDRRDAAGRECSPIGLLILGTMRYLGRGVTFHDLKDCTCISPEVHRVFFHSFIHFGRTILFQRYVDTPSNAKEAEEHRNEFDMAGLSGCIGSIDATHVSIFRCPSQLRNLHAGWKNDLPCRTYNLTTNHRRRILHTTTGHPATFNDKTLVIYDRFASGLKSGDILDDVIFHLYETQNGRVVRVPYRGAWLISDNGYLNWSTTIPPLKDYATLDEQLWSKWVESIRKDVECVFGILKGRFRVLKAGIFLHKTDAADAIWLTCCALHNFLLEVDGLDKRWQEGIESEYERAYGRLTADDFPHSFGLSQNHNDIDTSGMGCGRDVDNSLPIPHDTTMNQVPSGTSIRIVRNLNRDFFRDRLIEHFAILLRRKKIRWPSRTGLKPSANVSRVLSRLPEIDVGIREQHELE